MDKHQNFAKNLEAIRSFNQRSLGEFSEEIGIPKSTLQTVLSHGNTTLETAIRIADGLHLSLDVLLDSELVGKKVDALRPLLQSLGWFCALSPEAQDAVTLHIREILEVIQE